MPEQLRGDGRPNEEAAAARRRTRLLPLACRGISKTVKTSSQSCATQARPRALMVNLKTRNIEDTSAKPSKRSNSRSNCRKITSSSSADSSRTAEGERAAHGGRARDPGADFRVCVHVIQQRAADVDYLHRRPARCDGRRAGTLDLQNAVQHLCAVGFIALSGVACARWFGDAHLLQPTARRRQKRPRCSGGRFIDALASRPDDRAGASFGFVPMAIATGAGAEVQKPLAIVVNRRVDKFDVPEADFAAGAL